MENGTYVMTADGLIGIEATNGYWVAVGEPTLDAVAENDVVGIWTDSETGKTWVDKAVHFSDLSMAMLAGELYDQIAIWDIANNTEIRLDKA